MNRQFFRLCFFMVIVLSALICGCSASEPVFVPTPAPAATAAATDTPEIPEETPAPTPSPVETTTPEPVSATTAPSAQPENVSESTAQQASFFITAAPQQTGSEAAVEGPADTEIAQDAISSQGDAPTADAGAESAESITIGAVGDIMVMPTQLVAAYDSSTGKYDFSRSFYAVKDMFQGTDLMCGNLEGAIAGEKAGYSNGQTDSEGRIRFNAPDEFATDLKNAGFNVITTANNHAGDCNTDGVIATIRTLRNAGLYQTGTFESAEARKEPLVIDVNGYKIGILASTTVINGTVKMSKKDRDAMFSRLQYSDLIKEDIERCKAAGAEFIIMFAHWDKEYKNAPQKSTRNYAKQLLEMGVDCVIGSHPHVVQPFAKVTVTREDGSEYTGLVAYSLGNFISNMSGDSSYELFLQLTLSRDPSGKVVLSDAAYMPILCYAEDVGNKQTVHQTIPCLTDPSLINAYNGMSDKKRAAVEKARASVIGICGEDVVRVMEDECWIS